MNMEINEEIILKKYMPESHQLNDITNMFYAFSDKTRLKILILLFVKPMCVNDISEFLHLNQTTTSHQLKILRSFGIVEFDKCGKNVVYYIKNRGIENVFNEIVDCI